MRSTRVLFSFVSLFATVAFASGPLSPASAQVVDPLAPTAVIAAPSGATVGQTVTLDASQSTASLGTIDRYEWDLDGNGSYETDRTVPVVSHAFAEPGTYTIGLRVTDSQLATAEATDVITVRPRPVAAFAFAPASPLSAETVTFQATAPDPDDGSIGSYEWDLDNDGTTDASGRSTQTSFPLPGTRTVKLIVTDVNGVTESTTRPVNVANRLPTASFTISQKQLTDAGTVITFDSTATDSDGGIASWAWDLDGNGSFESSGASVEETYTRPGAVNVAHRVTDASGAQSTVTEQVTIENRPPQNVDFTYTPSTFQTFASVSFSGTARDLDGTIAKWEWDFNADGEYEKSGQNVSTQFTRPGTHVVRLKVTDDLGVAEIAEQTVTPGNSPPSASFTRSPSTPTTLQAVRFDSTSVDPDGTIALLSWDLDGDNVFGDAVGPTAIRQFATAGSYSVGLEVTDNDGSTNRFAQTFDVQNQPPSAGIDGPASSATLDEFTLTSSSSDPEGELPLTETWDLDGDGVFDDASGPVAKASFPRSGEKTIKLRVVDARGADAVATKTITINNRRPEPSFTYAPLSPRPFETVSFSSTSVDRDGSILSRAWDLDNDGSFDDGTLRTATKRFTEANSYTVRLRVVDDEGAEAIGVQTVFVGNRPPNASFTYLPTHPSAGESVSFFSTATDPDSPIAGQSWDLDGDGGYDDATGPSASRSYPAGRHTVGLLVVDTEGESAFFVHTLDVATPSPVRQAQSAGPRFLSPFPVVRIAGSIKRRGTRMRRLTVDAPTGATVTVRCRGRGCPFGRQSRVVKSSAKGRKRATRVVRIRRFERRMLRAGTVITILVTKEETIGKYTRFKIRKGRPPSRLDRCLLPGQRRPVECPPL
jgi:PKD repeat protein